MYDDQYFFVPNAINRQNISSRTQFKTNPDGSVDLYIQNESPGGEKEANWLPAPEGPFYLTMRIYWPEQAALDGTWTPPPVKRSN